MEPQDIRQLLQPFVKKQYCLPVAIFLFDLFFFLSIIFLLIRSNNIILQTVLSFTLAVAYTLLFIVGHDACHQSFTPSRKLNEWIGVIAFLPTLHNFGLWHIGHIQIHHSHTSFKPVDYVYTPLNRSEYEQLNWYKKAYYRIYRSVPGHLFYYLIEIWWKKMTNPRPYLENKQPVNSFWKYQIPVILYFISFSGFICLLSNYHLQSALKWFLLLFIIPFAVWNWLMGFAIFQHHTHPQTKWFENPMEWNYWEAQFMHSVHIRFPRWINFILHNIMEHTAHHGNMSIPLYQLSKAQQAINENLGDSIVTVDWSLKLYLNTIKHCKLYDTKLHRGEQF